MADGRRAPSPREDPIYMTAADMRRLIALVKDYRQRGRDDEGLAVLEAELGRAFVMDAERRLASDVVTLDSRAVVADLDTGEETACTVVLPDEADPDAGRISVLSPLGMAILGYRPGQEINWDVDGTRRRLMVRQVVHQPEAEERRRARRPPDGPVSLCERDPEDRAVDEGDAAGKREKMLDKTIADSFPASDPPSTVPDPCEDSFHQP